MLSDNGRRSSGLPFERVLIGDWYDGPADGVGEDANNCSWYFQVTWTCPSLFNRLFAAWKLNPGTFERIYFALPERLRSGAYSSLHPEVMVDDEWPLFESTWNSEVSKFGTWQNSVAPVMRPHRLFLFDNEHHNVILDVDLESADWHQLYSEIKQTETVRMAEALNQLKLVLSRHLHIPDGGWPE